MFIIFRSLMDASKSIGLLQPLEIDLADGCFPILNCNSSVRFRTIDGGCNNLIFPVWGQSRGANARIIQASYSDGTQINILIKKPYLDFCDT